MKHETRIPGQFVDAVTSQEVLQSAGLQLLGWAHDIAFTDAAFGEKWAVEAANRMATLSELLHTVYELSARAGVSFDIELPSGIVGVLAINPGFKPDAAKPGSKNASDADKEGGVQNSIDDFPF